MTRTAARRRTALLALTAALGLVLSGCSAGGSGGDASSVKVPGATAAQNSVLRKLYKQALDANKTQVVVYGPSPSTSAPLYAAFNRSFPNVKIVATDQADSTTLSKLKVEAKSGRRQGDFYIGGSQAITVAAQDPTLCAPTNVTTVPKSEVMTTDDGRLLNYGVKYFGFVYNTKLVKKADVPTTWAQLLDPKWKGKIEMSDPTVLGGMQFLLADMLLPDAKAQFGQTYLDKLVAQNPVYSTNEPNVAADVAAGRFPLGVGVFVGYYSVQKAKGASIGFQFPLTDGGNFTAPVGICRVKDAPDGAAADLFINWLFTAEGQKQLASADLTYGTLPGSPGPLGAPTLQDLKTLPTLGNDLKAYAPYFATVSSTFKK